jgi:hypothetical protein
VDRRSGQRHPPLLKAGAKANDKFSSNTALTAYRPPKPDS